MNFSIDNIHPFHQLLISTMLGLIVGLQREWRQSQIAGIRSFSLITLLGTVCAFLTDSYGSWPLMAGFIGIFIVIVSSIVKRKVIDETISHSGPVTELSMLLMYSAGVLVKVGPIWIAAAITGILAFILQAKIELHGIARKFTELEINSIMQFVLIVLVIFPLIPDRTFGPLNVFNPHDTWLMILIIVGISLSGYIIYKFWGERAGLLLSGVLGGLISSTATTVSYSKNEKLSYHSSTFNALIILIAWTTVYLRLCVEIALVAPGFNTPLIVMGILFFVSTSSTAWIWKKNTSQSIGMLNQENPTEIRTALLFGLIYSGVLLAVAFSKEYLGESGLFVVALISGITDMDAITLSSSKLVHTGRLELVEATKVIIVACISNVFFKGIIARIIGGKELFKLLFIPWLLTLCTGAFIFTLLSFFKT